MGDGFDLSTLLPVCDAPWSLLVADLSGNGERELVVSHASNFGGLHCGLGVLQVKRDAEFQAHTRFELSNPVALARPADLNHDGFVDVLAIDFEANEIPVMFGAGDGSLAPRPWICDLNADIIAGASNLPLLAALLNQLKP